MKKLLSTTEFVLEQERETISDRIYNYAKLVQQKPIIEHFIGDNAIFDGWEIHLDTEKFIELRSKNLFLEFRNDEINLYDNLDSDFIAIINTIEDLCKFNLTLK